MSSKYDVTVRVEAGDAEDAIAYLTSSDFQYSPKVFIAVVPAGESS